MSEKDGNRTGNHSSASLARPLIRPIWKYVKSTYILKLKTAKTILKWTRR